MNFDAWRARKWFLRSAAVVLLAYIALPFIFGPASNYPSLVRLGVYFTVGVALAGGVLAVFARPRR